MHRGGKITQPKGNNMTTGERKEYLREWHRKRRATTEGKAYQQNYDRNRRDPEVVRERNKDRKRVKRSTPEGKQYDTEYEKRYLSTPEGKAKKKARSAVSYALRRGKIERQPCGVDGCTRKAQAHHQDYNKPLEIEWLCQVHHAEKHSKGIIQ